MLYLVFVRNLPEVEIAAIGDFLVFGGSELAQSPNPGALSSSRSAAVSIVIVGHAGPPAAVALWEDGEGS